MWNDLRRYYLIEPNCYDSLYSLIVHYRSHPLRSPVSVRHPLPFLLYDLKRELFYLQGFSIILNRPVPQPCTHESKDWYHPSTTRAKAEELLRWIPRDGAFLVRPSERELNTFSISFRYEAPFFRFRLLPFTILLSLPALKGRSSTAGSNKMADYSLSGRPSSKVWST